MPAVNITRQRQIVGIILLVAILAFVVSLIYRLWRQQYPYGYCHCCDLQLQLSLDMYAAEHGGAFPSGQTSPEASLSLLYQDGQGADANLLRGFSVPESVVQDVLDRGELLDPNTCGWHYVEGLRIDDDPRIALFWDKEGLDHNGGRLPAGGHIVMFLDGQREHIHGSDWDDFLEKQKELLSKRDEAIHKDATLNLGDKVLQVQLRIMDASLVGRVWEEYLPSSRETLATIEGLPTSNVGLPVFTQSEIRNAIVAVEDHKEVRFIFGIRHIVYDGTSFRIQQHVDKTPRESGTATGKGVPD